MPPRNSPTCKSGLPQATAKSYNAFMKVAILGYGEQGKSAYEYWAKAGNEVTICDEKIPSDYPKDAKTKFGADYILDLQEFELIVRSPGIHPQVIFEANPEHPEIKDRITTNTNEFFKVCPTKKIIGVTGTKGKGTTSTLITKLLEAAGQKVHLGGNIGTPPLEMLKSNIAREDWVVLELANFQTIDLKYSPPIAVCLMITEEHLNWHKDMLEYIESKQTLFAHQTHQNYAIYNARNEYSEQIVTPSPAFKIGYDVPPEAQEAEETRGVYVDGEKIIAYGDHVCDIGDVGLLGRHNLENVCAAISATWELIGRNKKIVKEVVKNFSGLPHRLEFVQKINDVWYIDDSFGTTPETAIVAMQAINKPKVMISGGSEKGTDYQEMVQAMMNNNVKHVVAIGQTGPKIASLISELDQTKKIQVSQLTMESSMDDIIKTAKQYADKGDVVLLSTGCASFGMFANYKERGEKFKQAVKALAPAAK